MSYRCSSCGCAVPSGQPQLRAVKYRVVAGRREIEREVPVCPNCKRSGKADSVFDPRPVAARPQQPKPVAAVELPVRESQIRFGG